MYKIILYILFFGYYLSNGMAEDARLPVQTYYKNPTYALLVQITKENATYLSEEKNQDDKQHVLQVASIFMGQVLKNHPKYLDQYSRNFFNFSFYEKAIFLRALRSAEIKHYLLYNLSDKNLQEIVNNPNPLLLNHLQVTQAGDLDYVWASFFATGEESYIRQIIKLVNRDEELLLLAYEWINREQVAQIRSSLEGKYSPPDYSDIKKIIEAQSNKQKDYPTQFLISLTALRSLEEFPKQDATLGEIIQKIVENNPELDYFKKIHAALGNQ